MSRNTFFFPLREEEKSDKAIWIRKQFLSQKGSSNQQINRTCEEDWKKKAWRKSAAWRAFESIWKEDYVDLWKLTSKKLPSYAS